jgi:sialidase-1
MKSLLILCALLSASADLPFTDIFIGKTVGHYCYRVPNVVRAPSGTLLVFVEARGPSCDDQAPKDVMMSRSHDEGATWSAPEMVLPGFSLGGNQTL